MIGQVYKHSSGIEVLYDFQSKQMELTFSVKWLQEMLSKNVQDAFSKMIKDIPDAFTKSITLIKSEETRGIINSGIKNFTEQAIIKLLSNLYQVNVKDIKDVCHLKFVLTHKVK